jgi:ubiquinone/menaquinone biosynthesis C-methylase UbiE
MTEPRTLTVDEARAFYDRLGRRQDWQRAFEDPAIENMIAHADFKAARAVLEFGCGTGRIAERLLNDFLPPDARYLAIDVSSTMCALARARLARFGARAQVRLTDGSPATGAPAASFDRFFSNYVLDLMSADAIRAVVAEAHRVLAPAGRLCLVSLTHGRAGIARIVSRAWSRVHALNPSLVGGCRPIELCDYLDETAWRIEHREFVSSSGFPSEVVIASPREIGRRERAA